MAIELKFCRIVVLKDSIRKKCTTPIEELALYPFPMYLEDEHLVSWSTMAWNYTEDIANELKSVGLEREKDMTVISSSETASDVEWLEVGIIDRTPVCWKSGNDPRPVVRYEYVDARVSASLDWQAELKKYGIVVEPPAEDGSFLCRRGTAEVVLECEGSQKLLHIKSRRLPLERYTSCLVDHQLLADIGFCLWKTSQPKGQGGRPSILSRLWRATGFRS
jgi:hypothetical protein